MCGRFSLGLPPRDYVETVDDQLNNERPRGQAVHRTKAAHSGKETQSNNATSSQQSLKNDNDGDKGIILHSNMQEDDYYPTYNVPPGVQVPVVRLEEPISMNGYGEDSTDGRQENDMQHKTVLVQTMRWGLLPHYTKSIPHGADAMRTINARDDAVLSGQSMWTPLLRKGKRCVVFCQGFYEWRKKDDQKIAHFVGMKEKGKGRRDVNGNGCALMPMAGLWERCVLEDETSMNGQREMFSFTIITTESNKQLNFLHDRMPVILPNQSAIRTWLGMHSDTVSNEDICALLKPYDAGALDCYTVPGEVGKVGRNEKSFILPVASRKDGIAAAFGRVQKQKQQQDKQSTTTSTSRTILEEDGQDPNTETNAPLKEEVKAAEHVKQEEDEAKSKKRKAIHDQERADEEYARQLQKEEHAQQQQEENLQAAKRRKAKYQSTVQIKDERTSPSPAVERKQLDESDSTTNAKQPSSKFSPDPYNPPVSPTRPRGGYSTADNPDPAPYKRTSDKQQSPRRAGVGGGATSQKQRQLQESAKGTMDIRAFIKKG